MSLDASDAGTCLSSQTLVSVVEGLADPDARARVAAHASLCESCREVLSSLVRSGPALLRYTELPPRVERVLAAGTQVGRYVISHRVGAGGNGVVYAARDPELGRTVAVKVLRGGSDPALQERLRREAIAMARLTHPNVVAVHDVGTFDEQTFIAMEYVPGETLASWVATPRTPGAILEVYLAAGSGLAAAHAAHIVHRDFKPENVLIGEDGRVRVGDFGLARTGGAGDAPVRAASDPRSGSAPASSGDSPRPDLTAPGTLVGTPYYLAPELYRGAEADARSDQFSFCVAVFSALYGERPFEGDTWQALSGNVQAGLLRVPRTASRVPRRIRAALQRGLSADPDARFGSLAALLAELTPSPRRIAHGIVGLGALALAAALLVSSRSDSPDERCTGAAAAFGTAWSPDRRAAIQAAFTAGQVPYAAASFDRVSDVLDRYAVQWQEAHTDACRATRIRGEQTEDMLALRMTCLERRRQDAAALVDALAAADPATVTRAAGAARELGDVAACADLAALRQIVPPPTDLMTRARIAALTTRLAEARAKHRTGAYARTRELLRPIADEARALGYRPFEAEVEFLHGENENALGDLAQAEASMSAALWAAEAGRHDELAALAWARLVFFVGHNRTEFARAKAMVPHATAAIARLGGKPAIEERLEYALSGVAYRLGELNAALVHSEKAVALAERAYGPEHLRVAKAREGLAVIAQQLGQNDRAVQLLQSAIRIYERELGGHHPDVAHALANLGTALTNGHDYAAAELVLRRSLALREAVFSPDHREVAISLCSLSLVLRRQGKLDEALALIRRGVAIVERSPTPDEFTIVSANSELGQVEARLHHFAEADEHLRRAYEVASKVFGPDNQATMTFIAERADALMLQARWRAAAALYRKALPSFEHAEHTHDDISNAVANLARIDVELGRPARAIAPLEPLAAKLDDQPPELRVLIEFTLARALWDSGGDRARASRLAAHALAAGKQSPGAYPDDVQQIERWIASHPHRAAR